MMFLVYGLIDYLTNELRYVYNPRIRYDKFVNLNVFYSKYQHDNVKKIVNKIIIEKANYIKPLYNSEKYFLNNISEKLMISKKRDLQ